jgi:RNA recognition motif-containing protein
VGNVPFRATEAELQTWFEQAGFAVDTVRLIKDRESGEPRGFGFVEIGDDAAADRAVESCNGSPFMGRALVVNLARPREMAGELQSRPRVMGGGARG